MENKKSNRTKISVLELISVFKQSAKEGYNLLISANNNKNLSSKDFWSLFKQEYEQLSDENPENQAYVQRTIELNYFFELNEIYSKAILETQLSILEINPSQQLLFKTLRIISFSSSASVPVYNAYIGFPNSDAFSFIFS